MVIASKLHVRLDIPPGANDHSDAIIGLSVENLRACLVDKVTHGVRSFGFVEMQGLFTSIVVMLAKLHNGFAGLSNTIVLSVVLQEFPRFFWNRIPGRDSAARYHRIVRGQSNFLQVLIEQPHNREFCIPRLGERAATAADYSSCPVLHHTSSIQAGTS